MPKASIMHISVSRVNGPGKRVVVWFQGCSHKCPGCFNPESHPFIAKNEMDTRDLANEIIRQAEKTKAEGVTFSGGEPFMQAQALWGTILFLRMKAPQLSIMSYTGFTEEELKEMKLWNPIVPQMDVLVSGRYKREIPQAHPWAGSGNQIVRFVSNRYSESDVEGVKPGVEVHIDRNGNRMMTGFPVREEVWT